MLLNTASVSTDSKSVKLDVLRLCILKWNDPYFIQEVIYHVYSILNCCFVHIIVYFYFVLDNY